MFFLEIASYSLDAHIAFFPHGLYRDLFLWPACRILDAGSACQYGQRNERYLLSPTYYNLDADTVFHPHDHNRERFFLSPCYYNHNVDSSYIDCVLYSRMFFQ